MGLKNIYWLQTILWQQLHPSRNAILKHGTKTIGLAGQIHLFMQKLIILVKKRIFRFNGTLLSQVISDFKPILYQT